MDITDLFPEPDWVSMSRFLRMPRKSSLPAVEKQPLHETVQCQYCGRGAGSIGKPCDRCGMILE